MAKQNGHWNKNATWTLGIPIEGQEVMIPNKFTVIMGEKMKCKSIMLEGALVDENKPIDIETESIMVMGAKAKFIIGEDELNRFTSTCTITLLGCKPDETIGGMGQKFIGAMNGGVIKMHGKEKISWTQLKENASVGENKISLIEPVEWKKGDEIVITASRHINWNKDVDEAEKRIIDKILFGGQTITFQEKLNFPHTAYYEPSYKNTDGSKSWPVDLRAEVGVLSKNIKIQGEVCTDSPGFGGHIMIHGTFMDNGNGTYGSKGGEAYIDGIELFNMGQEGELGRYPFHWHMLGEKGKDQYIKNSSVHQSHNRAITIHGTWSTLVDNNFCYDHIGHGIFLEDGSERDNTISNNVVLLSKRPECNSAVTPSDNQLNQIQNRTPASFWITNPNNSFTGNVAAGCEGTGFWFAFPETPMGDSNLDPRFKNMEPFKEALGRFDGNKAHSNMSGFDVYDNLTSKGDNNPCEPGTNKRYDDHAILTNGAWNNPNKHYMDNCTWYANDCGVYAGTGARKGYACTSSYQGSLAYQGLAVNKEYMSNVVYRNNVFVDNRMAMMLATYNIIDNSLFIAESASKVALVDDEYKTYLYRVYDGAGTVKNSHLAGWDGINHHLLLNGGAADKHVNHCFENITYDSNGPLPIVLPDHNIVPPANVLVNSVAHPRMWSIVLRDKDGSLSNDPSKANTSIVGNHPFLLVGDEDQPNGWENTYSSPHKFVHHRLYFVNGSSFKPGVTAERTKAGTPKASTYHNLEGEGHPQFPLIVNEDFLYTYTVDNFDSYGPNNAKAINVDVFDAEEGDTYTVQYKKFGTLTGLYVKNKGVVLSEKTSLAEMEASSITAYYIDNNDDLYVKYVYEADFYRSQIWWTDHSTYSIGEVDSDGDNVSNQIESESGQDPFNQELCFDFTYGRQGWNAVQIINGCPADNFYTITGLGGATNKIYNDDTGEYDCNGPSFGNDCGEGWQLTADGGDPQITSPNLTYIVNGPLVFKVDVLSYGSTDSCVEDDFKMYWATSTAGFNEGSSKTVYSTKTDVLQTLIFDLGDLTGTTITQLRLDMPSNDLGRSYRIFKICELGESCDDGDQFTFNDYTEYDGTCTGIFLDNDNDGIPNAQDTDTESFETGWGIWNDGDSNGSRCIRFYNANRAYTGVRGIRLRGQGINATAATDPLDLSSASSAQIDFVYLTYAMESGDGFLLEVDRLGTGIFELVDDWYRNIDFVNGPFYGESITVIGPFSANTKFRFKCAGNHINDFVFIDDIAISGCGLESGTAKSASNLEEINVNDFNLFVAPNPSNGVTNIQYTINEDSKVELSLYDVTGKLVKELFRNKSQSSNQHTVQLNMKDLQSGTYILHMKTDKASVQQKILLIK